MESKANKHTDVGEKIGGAKKDIRNGGLTLQIFGTMTPEERVLLIKRDNIWPPPDFEKLKEEGWSPVSAKVLKTLRGLLAPVPNKKDENSQRDFVQFVTKLRDLVCLHPDPDTPVVCETSSETPVSRTLLEDINEFLVREGLLCDGRLHITDALRASLKGPKRVVGDDVWVQVTKSFQVLGNPKQLIYSSRDATWTSLLPVHSVTKTGKNPENILPVRPTLESEVQEKSWRNGRDVDGYDLIKTFGFRGIEHGNWMDQKDRQRVLNATYDAFMALSEGFGIPPSGISMNGRLAIAFGARGSGKASAHYEPGRQVMNLTKFRGDGSLAHEWFHALDHYLGSVAGIGDPLAHASTSYKNLLLSLETKPVGSALELLVKKGFRIHSVGGNSEFKDYWIPRIHDKATRFAEACKAFGSIDVDPMFVKKFVVDLENIPANKFETLKASESKVFMDRINEVVRGVQGIVPTPLVKAETDFKKSVLALVQPARYRRGGIWDYVVPEFLVEAYKLENKNPPSNYYPDKGVSSSGPYSPTEELFARAGEAIVFDILKEKKLSNAFLVHGVEGERFASPEFRGNPYPTGTERTFIREQVQTILDWYAKWMTKEQKKDVEKVDRVLEQD